MAFPNELPLLLSENDIREITLFFTFLRLVAKLRDGGQDGVSAQRIASLHIYGDQNAAPVH